MSNFIGFTIGLQTPVGFIKAEYNRRGEDVVITAASAYNLGQAQRAGSAVVSATEFNERPANPYDEIVEARWAFKKLGIAV